MYFTVAVKIRRDDDKGKTKTYTERYLVQAVSVTDSEAIVVKYMEKLGEKDFTISSSSVSKIVDVIDEYFKVASKP